MEDEEDEGVTWNRIHTFKRINGLTCCSCSISELLGLCCRCTPRHETWLYLCIWCLFYAGMAYVLEKECNQYEEVVIGPRLFMSIYMLRRSFFPIQSRVIWRYNNNIYIEWEETLKWKVMLLLASAYIYRKSSYYDRK